MPGNKSQDLGSILGGSCGGASDLDDSSSTVGNSAPLGSRSPDGPARQHHNRPSGATTRKRKAEEFRALQCQVTNLIALLTTSSRDNANLSASKRNLEDCLGRCLCELSEAWNRAIKAEQSLAEEKAGNLLAADFQAQMVKALTAATSEADALKKQVTQLQAQLISSRAASASKVDLRDRQVAELQVQLMAARANAASKVDECDKRIAELQAQLVTTLVGAASKVEARDKQIAELQQQLATNLVIAASKVDARDKQVAELQSQLATARTTVAAKVDETCMQAAQLVSLASAKVAESQLQAQLSPLPCATLTSVPPPVTPTALTSCEALAAISVVDYTCDDGPDGTTRLVMNPVRNRLVSLLCEEGRRFFLRDSRQEITAKVVPFPKGRVPKARISWDNLATDTFKTVLLSNLPIWASKENIITLINYVGDTAERACAREEGRKPQEGFIVSEDELGYPLVDIRWVRPGRGPVIAGAYLDSSDVDTDYCPNA